jgi:ATP-binding cassette subfamily F protein uup
MSLLRFEQVELAFGTHVLLDKVSLNLAAGDRVGLLGRNGAGKSSLLRLVAGQQQPDGGQVWRTAGLRVAELAQELPPASEVTVYDWVAGGLARAGELLQQYHQLVNQPLDDERALAQLQRVQAELEAVDGWRLQQQVDAVLQRLALAPDATLASLSGGWRRRAALARALVQEPDVLLLDEPTNHLDIAAITWLEQEIAAFPGAVVLVTHDRSFLDNVVSSTLVFDGDGHISEHVGGYSDWQRELARQPQAAASKAPVDKKAPVAATAEPVRKAAGKLSYKLQRELEALPEKIEQLETEIAALTAQTQEAGFFTRERAASACNTASLAAKQAELDTCYERWQELDNA